MTGVRSGFMNPDLARSPRLRSRRGPISKVNPDASKPAFPAMLAVAIMTAVAAGRSSAEVRLEVADVVLDGDAPSITIRNLQADEVVRVRVHVLRRLETWVNDAGS